MARKSQSQSQNSVTLALVSLPPQKRLPRGHILMAMLEKDSEGKLVAAKGTIRSFSDERYSEEYDAAMHRLVNKNIELVAQGVPVEFITLVDTSANYGTTQQVWRSGKYEEAISYLKEHHQHREQEQELPF